MTVHSIDVESALQVINFVLENPGIPSVGIDGSRFSPLVQVFNADSLRPRHDGGKTRQAEAPLMELDFILSGPNDLGIDEHVKWHRPPPFQCQFPGGKIFQDLFLIFNYRKL